MLDDLFVFGVAKSADAAAIATRVRSLIVPQDAVNLAAAARRLNVSESALKSTIDTTWPQPNLLVLLAVVREYGVDPMWLITGDYSQSTHLQAVEDDGEARATVLRLLVERQSPRSPTSLDETAP